MPHDICRILNVRTLGTLRHRKQALSILPPKSARTRRTLASQLEEAGEELPPPFSRLGQPGCSSRLPDWQGLRRLTDHNGYQGIYSSLPFGDLISFVGLWSDREIQAPRFTAIHFMTYSDAETEANEPPRTGPPELEMSPIRSHHRLSTVATSVVHRRYNKPIFTTCRFAIIGQHFLHRTCKQPK